MLVEIAPHPLLDLGLVEVSPAGTGLPRPLGELPSPRWLIELLADSAGLGGATDPDERAAVRAAVRDLLRRSGFRPTGRNKPSSEYLERAVAEARLDPINLAVDICNAASLRSGLPVSVVDLDRTRPPLRVDVAAVGSRYVFNRSGQEIDVGGLICLSDADGPCANAVKDAERTKTGASTRNLLFVVWGTRALRGRTARTVAAIRDLVARAVERA